MDELSHTPTAADTPAKKPSPATAMPPKTSGERYYDRLQFLTADAFIIAVSAALAYVARYGPEQYGKIPNYLKQFQRGVEHFFLDTLKLGKGNEFVRGLGYAASATTLTMWGGNIFAPVLKAFENNKKEIVTRYNEKHGKPGEVEAGHLRLNDVPKQNWGDVIKGRAVGWAIVFGSFVGVDRLLGKRSEATNDVVKGESFHMRRLEAYEERVGRKIAGMVTQEGKKIAVTPLSQTLTAEQQLHKPYLFGRMIALDVFAASAALLIWNLVSRLSAKQRHEQGPGRVEDTAAVPPSFTDKQRAMPHPSAPETTVVAASMQTEQRLASPEVKVALP